MIPKRIIWHHSASQLQGHQASSIDQWHKDRAFPISSLGHYIGYHFVIEKDGSVFKARELNEIGAHDQGENIDSIGICLAGDFNKERPTAAQFSAFRALWIKLVVEQKIPMLAIEPHRRDDSTDCPGQLLTDDWPLTGI